MAPPRFDPRTSGSGVSVNTELQSRAISHAIFLERLKSAQVRKLVETLNDDVLPDIAEEVERRLKNIATRGFDTGPKTTARTQALFAAVQAITSVGLGRLREDLVSDLARIGSSEADFQTRMLSGVIRPINFEFVAPSDATLRAVVSSRPMQGRLLRDWWSGLETGSRTEIQRQLNLGLIQGESVPAIVRRLEGTQAGRFGDGAFGRIRRNVESITRTAVNHVTTHAREETYKENSDFIKGVLIVATLDSRTTQICMSLDGRVFPVDSGPRPPFHFGCRTGTAPVVKSLRELGLSSRDFPPGTRASMNGQVPATTTYGEWILEQPRSFQDEVLGPGRAELLRSGKITVEQFTDSKLRVRSLDELLSIAAKAS